MASNPPISYDYAYWSLLISAIALVASVFSVIAEYVGLFRKKLNIPVGQMVIIYQNNGETLGGKVTSRTREEVIVEDAFRIAVHLLMSGPEPSFEPTARMGDLQIPVSSIIRWSKFPESLSEKWANFPRRQVQAGA